MTPRPDPPRLVLDPTLRAFEAPDGGIVLAGGRPGRLLRLSRTGTAAFRRLVSASTERGQRPGGSGTGSGTGRADDQLGRTRVDDQLAARLVGAGMAHPRPPRAVATDGRVTVVVPARDRPGDLDRCLGALGAGIPVIVVDDGSDDPMAIADVCRRHGARVVRREQAGGPAAALNAGWDAAGSELVAFVDSDCMVTEGWLGDLAGWFDDDAVAAVAPRVRPLPPAGRRTVLARFGERHGPLDLGDRPSPVGPGRAVAYVPTTTLVVRRDLHRFRFDPSLRFGEDVDLVWRLVEAGHVVRYDPSVVVHHREPDTWGSTLARRFRYGTSAAALARRHEGRPAAAEVQPVPAVIAGLVLTGAPAGALAVATLATIRLAGRVRPFGIPATVAGGWVAAGAWWTLVGLGRAATMLASPLLVAAAGGRWAGRRGRRAAWVLLLAAPLADWWRLRPDLDPARWTLASIADDAAYGLGVWAGCLRHRTLSPLRVRRDRSGQERVDRGSPPPDTVAGRKDGP